MDYVTHCNYEPQKRLWGGGGTVFLRLFPAMPVLLNVSLIIYHFLICYKQYIGKAVCRVVKGPAVRFQIVFSVLFLPDSFLINLFLNWISVK